MIKAILRLVLAGGFFVVLCAFVTVCYVATNSRNGVKVEAAELYETKTRAAGPIDVIIPVCKKDLATLEYAINGIRENGLGVRRIIVISDKKYTETAEWFDEALFPFSKDDVAKKIIQTLPHGYHYTGKRNGWIYQQFLKLYAPFVIPNIAENVLALDSDTIFLNPVSFFDSDGAALYNVGTEFHKPYFVHAKKLIAKNPINKVFPRLSGICHHMILQKNVLADLFNEIQQAHNEEAWKVMIACIDPAEIAWSCMSEYEIYFNYVFSRGYKVKIRPLKWENFGFNLDRVNDKKSKGFHYVSCHEYMSKR